MFLTCSIYYKFDCNGNVVFLQLYSSNVVEYNILLNKQLWFEIYKAVMSVLGLCSATQMKTYKLLDWNPSFLVLSPKRSYKIIELVYV